MKCPLIIFHPIILFSCSQDEDQALNRSFEFISEYSPNVTVGGFVGIQNENLKKEKFTKA